jgi:hypothetical protein
MVLWLEHGGEAPASAASVDMVNRMHRHYAKEYRAGFADVDDYIYILCLNATAVNSSIESLGIPGFDDKQKTPVHFLWSRLAEHFEHVVEGRPVTELQPFPADHDAMVGYVEDYQARPWPVHARRHAAPTSMIEHFAATQVPRATRQFGRALVTAFLAPTVLRVHSIEAPGMVMRALARKAMKAHILISSMLRDPEESYSDRQRRLAATGRTEPSVVDSVVHRKIGRSISPSLAPEFGGAASLCPHLATLTRSSQTSPDH